MYDTRGCPIAQMPLLPPLDGPILKPVARLATSNNMSYLGHRNLITWLTNPHRKNLDPNFRQTNKKSEKMI